MQRRTLATNILGIIGALLFFANTIFWCVALYGVALLRWVPIVAWRTRCSNAMIWIAETWIAVNAAEINFIHDIKWTIRLPEGLRLDRSYLVIANHQSWVDITGIQYALNRKIPFLRFFLKSELRYVPFLGAAWKALDFPFMKRYSREYLEKHPEKRGEDLKETKRACEKLRGKPISILNFLEGTRLTPEKHRRTNSPFQNLLAPKTGGVAFVIEAMGDQFDSILDITVQYPGGAPSMWDLFSGTIPEIRIWVERIPIPREMLGGNYFGDENFRAGLQAWIHEMWLAKDKRLS